MTMITPSSKLTLTKGNKSWSSTAVAAALELVDPPGCRNSWASHPACGVYRIRVKRLSTDTDSFVERVLLKTFQNLRVSSPAPVTMASPSGDMAR